MVSNWVALGASATVSFVTLGANSNRHVGHLVADVASLVDIFRAQAWLKDFLRKIDNSYQNE